MTLHTSNPIIGAIVEWLLRKKSKKFLFQYEQTVYKTDVVDQTYVRHWIADLEEAVNQEVVRLTEEYKL